VNGKLTRIKKGIAMIEAQPERCQRTPGNCLKCEAGYALRPGAHAHDLCRFRRLLTALCLEYIRAGGTPPANWGKVGFSNEKPV